MDHGGDLTEAWARHGAGDPPWLDLSTGINPHPWPVPDGVRREGWERLPSRAVEAGLLGVARRAYRVPEAGAIVAAPGTQALIQWLPRLAPPGDVAVLGPTYAEHAASWRAAGRNVHDVADVRDLAGAVHAVVVRPNNPDGALLDAERVREIAERCGRRGGWLVVDESFADLDPAWSVAGLAAGLPVIVLRSFGKFYGLAGLRLGFAIAPPAIAGLVGEAIGPWAVSGPALAVGAAGLADEGWAEAMRVRLAAEAWQLDEILRAGGLAPAGGTDLYRLVRHARAGELHDALAVAHIWCRAFAWAPDLLRFGLPPDDAARERLRAALARALHAQGTRTG